MAQYLRSPGVSNKVPQNFLELYNKIQSSLKKLEKQIKPESNSRSSRSESENSKISTQLNTHENDPKQPPGRGILHLAHSLPKLPEDNSFKSVKEGICILYLYFIIFHFFIF